MVWPQARLCSSQHHILYAFLWLHLPGQPEFRFFSPSTSLKVPVSVYFSFLVIFDHSFFVWLYPVNPGIFYLSLMIYIFQYMDILFLLLSFAFRKNWRLSEQVFVNCYQDFVLFLLLWFGIKKMGGPRASLNKCFPVAQDFVFFAQEIFTVVHPSILKENAWWCAWAMSLR